MVQKTFRSSLNLLMACEKAHLKFVSFFCFSNHCWFNLIHLCPREKKNRICLIQQLSPACAVLFTSRAQSFFLFLLFMFFLFLHFFIIFFIIIIFFSFLFFYQAKKLLIDLWPVVPETTWHQDCQAFEHPNRPIKTQKMLEKKTSLKKNRAKL